MKKQDKTRPKTDKETKTNKKSTKGSSMRAEYEERPDGLTNGTGDVMENLAQNAWFPALYADEVLMDEFPAGGPLV
ncbi:MAG: hypothetical protein HDT26_07345 [Subdoligranulum sp.]|nr:hypothetical protein [Subdoligranulum sp.]